MLVGASVNPILTASDPSADDSYGYCVSLAKGGNMLVVGAEAWEGSLNDQGAVYTYDWTGSNYQQRGSVLLAPDAGAGDFFGRAASVTEDGQTLVVGAHQWDGASADQGGVYTFDWSGGAWVQRGTVLTAPDAGAGDLFGQAVAISADGNTMAVGAICWDGTYVDQGAVYLFARNGAGWTHTATITASDAGYSFAFGRGVALSDNGDTLIVGSDLWCGTYESQGAVYTFDLINSEWVQRGSVLTAYDAHTDDRFGNAVALSQDGTVLAVGAEKWTGTAVNQGRAYLYDLVGSDWVYREPCITAIDAAAGDRFCKSVSIGKNKDCLVIGAHQWEGSYTNQGAVYMYFL